MKNIYSVEDLTTLLQLSAKTIRKYIKSGELVAYYIGNGYRISEEHLQAFLESKKQK